MRRSDLLILPLVTALVACGGAEGDTAPARPEANAAPVRVLPASPSVPGAPAEAPGLSPGAAPPAGSPAGVGSQTGSEGARAPQTGSAVAVAAPAGTQAEPAAPAPEAERILGRAERAYGALQSVRADFVQELDVPLLGSTQRSRGVMYTRRPDRFLMKFSDPAGDVIVADGRHFWMYYPSSDATQVMRAPIGEGGQQADLQREFLSRPTERYTATLSGSEAVGGRPAHVLTLVPKGRSPYRGIKIWVDKEDYLVRRFEMTEQNGTVRRVELRNLQRNPQLNDALFRFTPPPNAQIFDQ